MLKPIETAADFQLILQYIERLPYEDSILNIGNIVQWNTVYPIFFEEDVHHRYVIMISKRSEGTNWTAYVPLCEPIYFELAINKLREHFESISAPFQMKWIPLAVLDLVRPYFQKDAEVLTTDDESDYLYEAEPLRTLAGKKQQKKRNHVNAFINEYQGRYLFRVLSPNDIPEINQFLDEWRAKKGGDNPLLQHEMQGIPAMLMHWQDVGLRGGGLYLDDKMIGFVLVCVTVRGTVQINVEKADGEIRGAYPILQQLTLQVLAPEVKMVNREDDGGIDYLRKAKQSMHPTMMLQKWTLKESSGPLFFRDF